MRKLRVVLKNCRASDPFDVINRCRESDRACDVGRASFEPMRRFLECALFERDAYDHFTATVPRWHRIQDLRASVERTDTGRCTHFVSGKREEIAAQLLHIERHMPDALRRVDQRQRAYCARFLAEFSDWIDCAQRI